MFKSLNFKDMKVVVMAMEVFSCTKGEQVIREGEEGDCVYVVESGDLKCTKVIDGQVQEIKSYS
jgi:cAMP-dependent protein kinase regulator